MRKALAHGEKRYIPHGLISRVEQHEAHIILYRLADATDVLVAPLPHTQQPYLRFSGYEQVVLLVDDKKLSEGSFELVAKQQGSDVVYPLTLHHVEDTLFLGIVEPIFECDNYEVVPGEHDLVTVLKTRNYARLGASIECFLYAGNICSSYSFFKAKERILRALGAPEPERFGWQESLSVEAAFDYNLRLEQAHYAQERETRVKKKVTSFVNPLLPAHFTFSSLKKGLLQRRRVL